MAKEYDFGGKQREKERSEGSPQTLCPSMAAWVFVYPPALWLWKFSCSGLRTPQLPQGSGEDPKTRATEKPPSLSEEKPQGCIRANKRKIRSVVLGLKIEKNQNIGHRQNCEEMRRRKFGIKKETEK